jgi:hypothetical protein
MAFEGVLVNLRRTVLAPAATDRSDGKSGKVRKSLVKSGKVVSDRAASYFEIFQDFSRLRKTGGV